MKLKYADRVTNIAASEDNPIKYGIFVRHLHGGEAEYITAQGVHHTPLDNLELQDNFPVALYSMELAERINDNKKAIYGFDWVITRVPGGWIYTAETALSPCSVFVPYNNDFSQPY